ncbi:MAG: GNAT family N-acetyltransferase [Chloroflexota bacterium]
MEYTVRAARITDIDKLVAISGEQIGARGSGTALDAADLLRQLVYLPHASVLVAERRREIVGGAILAIRPSVRAGGYVGTIDLLAVAPNMDADDVTESLLEEALRSAANKGCASVEAPRPDDPTERARWERQGFGELGPHMGRVLAPAGAGGRRAR